jgi:hypothetical protein
MSFSQTFNGPVNNVYNIEGDLILGPSSGIADFRSQLVTVSSQIDHDAKLDPSVKEAASAEVQAAHTEAQSVKPDASVIKSHLDKAADAVKSASALTVSAGALAKTLFDLGTWAVHALA